MHMRKTTDYSVVATLIASDYSYLVVQADQLCMANRKVARAQR